MNLNISSHVKTVRNLVTANSPVLLVGTAIVGVVTTGVLAAKGGYKARGIIDAEESKRALQTEPAPPLTFAEKTSLTWLCYAVPAVTGASTILSVVGVHAIHSRRSAAMAGLYAVTAGKFDDYVEAAEEKLGTKKTQDLNNELAQKHVDDRSRDPHYTSHEVVITGNGKELCHDSFTGRWFDGNLGVIQNAVHEVNLQLVESGDASLNDFYDHVGLPPVDLGEDLGWSGAKVSVRTGTVTSPDGRAALSFWFQQTPQPNMGRK